MKRTFISRRKLLRNDLLVGSGLLWLKRRFFPRRSILILGYHILDTPSFLRKTLGVASTARRFEDEIVYIARHHTVLNLDQVMAVVRGAIDPLPGSICITFDDGYRDVLETALPILKRHGIPAAVFIATDSVESQRSIWTNRLYGYIAASQGGEVTLTCADGIERRFQFNDISNMKRNVLSLSGYMKQFAPDVRDRLLEDVAVQLSVDPALDPIEALPMLNWDQVRRLHEEGMTIGSHTVSHAILSRCSPEQMRRELTDSKRNIEAHLGVPCKYLAYPNGQKDDFDAATKKLAEEVGYEGAFSFFGGTVSPGTDAYAIPRKPIFDVPLNSFAVSIT